MRPRPTTTRTRSSRRSSSSRYGSHATISAGSGLFADAGQRTRPVALPGVARRRLGTGGLAMGDEPGTATTADDAGVETVERASILQSGRIVTRSSPDGLWNVQV